MRPGLLTIGIILLVLGAIFYFVPSPAVADETETTQVNGTTTTTSAGVTTPTYATAAEIYGIGNESDDDDDSTNPFRTTGNRTNETDDDNEVVGSPFEPADDRTGSTTSSDDDMDEDTTSGTARTTGTTARTTSTTTRTTAGSAAADDTELVDYDGDGVPTLYVVVTEDSVRPATDNEIDAINEMMGEDDMNTQVSDDLDERAVGDDDATSDDETENVTDNTTNGTRGNGTWTGTTTRTTTDDDTAGDDASDYGTSEDDDNLAGASTLAGTLELQGEAVVGEGNAGTPVTTVTNDTAANGTVGAGAGVSTGANGGDADTADTTTTGTVEEATERTAAAAGGFLGNPVVRTIALLSMILGAILTLLGLILPAPEERAARDADRAARTTGAAGRRVEYERDTIIEREVKDDKRR